MNKFSDEINKSLVYNPINKWWEYLLLWGAFNGEVKVYEHKTRKKEGKKWSFLGSGLAIGLAKIVPYFLPVNNYFVFSTPMQIVILILFSYILTVLGMIFYNKTRFINTKKTKKMEYCGIVRIRLYEKENRKRIATHLALILFLWMFAIIFVIDEQVIGPPLYFILTLFCIPGLVLTLMGNKLEIGKRIEEGELIVDTSGSKEMQI